MRLPIRIAALSPIDSFSARPSVRFSERREAGAADSRNAVDDIPPGMHDISRGRAGLSNQRRAVVSGHRRTCDR